MNFRFLRLTVGIAALGFMATPLVAADYYVGDTGRKAQTGIPSMEEVTSAMTTSASKTAEVPPILQLDPKDLYSPELEKEIKNSGLNRIAVQSEGVEITLQTFAEINVNAITGKSKFDGQDSVYTVLGMIFENKQWVRVPMIPVESAALAKEFGLDPKLHNHVSATWVMKTPRARTLVMGMLSGNESFSKDLPSGVQKALKKFAFRVASFLNLPGEFKLVPMKGEGDIWLAAEQIQHPDNVQDADLANRISGLDLSAEPFAPLLKLDSDLHNSYDSKKPTADIKADTSAFLGAVSSSPGYMKPWLRKLDFWQTEFQPFQKSALLFMLAFFGFLIYLLTGRKKSRDQDLGSGQANPRLIDGRAEEYAPKSRAPLPGTQPAILEKLIPSLQSQPSLAMSGAGSDAVPGSFVNSPAYVSDESARDHTERSYGDPILQAQTETGKGSPTAWRISYLLMIAASVLLIIALANRAFIGGRMPVSNMYESITFAMGAFSIVSIIFEAIYRRGWIGIGACFAGWILMTMANSLPLSARKVEPLVAVLNSVWLNFHVTSLLISYSCFLLAFVCSVLYLIKDMTGNRPGMLPRAETFEYLTYRSVQVGWPLLTLGIFLGAVWANTAWGSFWSWDPKETWALITWLTYTIYLHLRINLGWNGRKSIIASMVGFIMVLLTYFGVSYLPGISGGMHSYAEPISY